jgi:hypothetical protein
VARIDVDVPIDLVVVTPDLSSPGRREVTVAFIIYGFLRLRKTGEFLILVMDGRPMTVEISI